MADPEFVLIVFGILLGIIILACAVIRICDKCDEPIPVQETRGDREGHNRGNHNRNDSNRNDSNRNKTNNGNRNNGLQSKLRSQSFNYVSPYVQNFFDQQSQSGSFRTQPPQPDPEPTEPGPSQAGLSQPRPTQPRKISEDPEGIIIYERDRNNRNYRMNSIRSNANIENRNDGLQSNSKLRAQNFNHASPNEQNCFEQQSQSGSFRTQPPQPEPTEPGPSQAGPSQAGPTQLRPIPSAPPLSILSDQTRSPRDIAKRNLYNKSPNPPPPSYRDLFPSDSSSES